MHRKSHSLRTQDKKHGCHASWHHKMCVHLVELPEEKPKLLSQDFDEDLL